MNIFFLFSAFREDSKVSHYIINKIQQGEHILYRIGDQSFPDLPDLLAFYKLHYLDTTPLRRPLQRKVERVVGKFDFEGSDSDDLPFKKGEILYIISKDEDQWWTAKNSVGQTGQIPVPYVQRVSFHNFFIELPFLTALICLFQYEDAHQSTIERPGSGGHLSHSLHSDNTLKKNNLNVSFLILFYYIFYAFS